MSRDEKLAVISGILRDSVHCADRSSALRDGALLELALIANEESDDSAADLASLIIPGHDRTMLAKFCRLYHKYRSISVRPFPAPESAELPTTVMIPEIARLDEALALLKSHGIDLRREHGDSFSSCAEDVQFGRSRYVLMPLRDPAEGRLRSFDRLRENCGLKIHCTLNVTSDDGDHSYQLCGLGFPDGSLFPATRLSFTADTDIGILDYLNGAVSLGAAVLSAELDGGEFFSRIRAVLNISGMDDPRINALIMYLNAGADLTIDGCFAEL